jgi:hypothetical protein
MLRPLAGSLAWQVEEAEAVPVGTGDMLGDGAQGRVNLAFELKPIS